MFLHTSMFVLLAIKFYIKKTEGYELVSDLNFTEVLFSLLRGLDRISGMW